MKSSVLAFVLLAAISAHADAPVVEIPRNRLVLQNIVAASMNPIGLEDRFQFGFQRRLGDSDHILFNDIFLFGGVAGRVNPAFVSAGPVVEYRPIAVFSLRLSAEFFQFFGTMGFLQSWGSPLDEHSDAVRSAGELGSANYGTVGTRLGVEPVLQAKLGPVALHNKFSLDVWNVRVREGDTVFYDTALDTAVPANGPVLTDELTLLYLSGPLRAGLQYRWVQPLYDAGDFRPGETPPPGLNGHHKLGPLLAWTFFDAGYAGFDRPTVFLITGWYLDHRYRTAEAALPSVVLGFSSQSDFL